jgi:hypothetical protein
MTDEEELEMKYGSPIGAASVGGRVAMVEDRTRRKITSMNLSKPFF